MGIGSWVDRRARIAPERPAMIWGSETRSYEHLAARIRRLATGLVRLGVQPGDRVAWLGPNHPAFLETLFGVARIGAILAPVNHRLEEADRAWILADIEPAVVIRHRAVPPTPAPASVREELVTGTRGPAGTPGQGGGLGPAGTAPPTGTAPATGIDLEELIAASPDDAPELAVGIDEVVLLPHTSGTTSRPKGVMLTHGNLTWNVVNLLSIVDFRPDDVTIAIAPFFRVGGTGVNVLPVLFLGGAVVVPETSGGDEILRLMEDHRVTVGFGNPDLLAALVAAGRWPVADLSPIRLVLTGGAPVPERLIRTFHDRGVPLVQGYGLSEAAPVVLVLDPRRAMEKPGSAGRPPVLVEVRIADRDGNTVPAGATGELLVRGPNVMAGYWRRPAATVRVLSGDGWLRTGDAARVDADGDTWIVDRVSAAFVVDGHTVFPGDVERVLAEHPAVADVAVLPIVIDGATLPAALVVPAPGAPSPSIDDIRALAARRLAPHQHLVVVRLVDRLPRSSVGKLARESLPGVLAATDERWDDGAAGAAGAASRRGCAWPPAGPRRPGT